MRAKLFLLSLIAGLALVPAWAQAYTYEIIHDFCSKRLCRDGMQPVSGLTMDVAGNLYGTTYGPSSAPAGNVYELVPKAGGRRWGHSTLFQFTRFSPDGFGPQSGVIVDTAGNVYGTTTYGGADSITSTAYELISNGGHKMRTHKRIANLLEGGNSFSIDGLSYRGQASGVPYDGSSPLYGTLLLPGSGGSAYRLTTDGIGGWMDVTIYRFCSAAGCADGSDPRGNLLVDAGGNLLGTTQGGGAHGAGTVYELADTGGASWTETTLHTFCAEAKCRDGAGSSGLMADALGNLYGVAGEGRNKPGCCGLTFELEPGGAYSPLYKFCALADCRDGLSPQGPPVMDSSGTLYGVAQAGGGKDDAEGGGGTIYALSGSTLTTLYRFCSKRDCRDGKSPNGPLVIDAHGNLFGTTRAGGGSDAGVVFELSP